MPGEDDDEADAEEDDDPGDDDGGDEDEGSGDSRFQILDSRFYSRQERDE